MTEVERDWIRQRRAAELANRDGRSPVTAGARSVYRPGELLLSRAADDQLADLLRTRYSGSRDDQRPVDSWRNAVGIPAEQGDVNGRLETVDRVLWQVPAQADLPAVVRELRGRLSPDDHAAQVALNQVYFGEPLYQGGPGGEPYPVSPVELAAVPEGVTPGVPDLAALDTGLPADWETLHPPLAGWLTPDLDNRNTLVAPDGSGKLATEAGHGLFIAGLIRRVAPGLVIDPGRVLDPTGFGDDASIGAELVETTAAVICLSLGGYTEDDAPPAALSAALAAKGRGVAVVAAAGNNDSGRPFWPAALKHVIAVAGYDSTGGGQAKTDFSNWGDWVDVCAPAVRVTSTYVQGIWPAHDGDRTFDGWARWSGTSFAAPLVAAEIARRRASAGRLVTGRQAALSLLAELDPAPWPELGLMYHPALDVTG
jgi:subtilisin family serine protease